MSDDRKAICRPEPFVEGCDQHGRLVVDGELVVSRGHRAVALDAALHRVALFVIDSVELRRTASVRAELPAVADLVSLFRNGGAWPDAASTCLTKAIGAPFGPDVGGVQDDAGDVQEPGVVQMMAAKTVSSGVFCVPPPCGLIDDETG
ncbi:hypothetical protein ACIQW4_23245 [Streptomyces albogriseolus]|uniref:hypothetical protein n=1 Tax=Streptomyces albogriseolus TaxID=1887 RepID=UPI003815F302